MHDSDSRDTPDGQSPSAAVTRRPALLLNLRLLAAAVLAVGLLTSLCIHRSAQRTIAAIDRSVPDRPVNNAPFITTPEDVVDKMIEVADLSEDDLLYDLGCGDGRIAIAAAKRHGCRAVGFDIDPERVAEARQNAKESGVEDLVTIEQADVFELDLSPANRVVMYLLPLMIKKLIPQLEQLPPGSRIVSHDFEMAGVPPVETHYVSSGDTHEHTLYVWTTPLKKK